MPRIYRDDPRSATVCRCQGAHIALKGRSLPSKQRTSDLAVARMYDDWIAAPILPMS